MPMWPRLNTSTNRLMRISSSILYSITRRREAGSSIWITKSLNYKLRYGPMELMTFDPDGDLLLLFPRRPEDREAAEVDPSECISNQSATEERRLVILKAPPRSDTVAAHKTDVCPVDIRMLVSSRHMMLASRVFKVMLSNTFSEGLALRSTGQLELPLPDDDPVAFEILLNIIHGHPRSVPRQIDLLLFSRLAMMVDKYELQEVVAVFSDTWITQLQNTLPKSCTPDLPPWLFISWVYDKPSIFSHVTKILQLESTGRLEEDELASFPIPKSIIGIKFFDLYYSYVELINCRYARDASTESNL
jgi:hypothetical protein